MKHESTTLTIVAVMILVVITGAFIGWNTASAERDKYRTAYEQSLDREKDANEVIRVKDGQIEILLKAGCGEKK